MLRYLIAGILLFPSLAYGQEEFFGFRNGISLSYSHSVESENWAIGVGVHLEKGGLFGAAINGDATGFFVGKMFEPDIEKNFPVKPLLSLSFSALNGAKVLTPGLGLTQCFFMNSSFPFSISAAMQVLCMWQEYGYTKGYYLEVENAYTFGYTQSLFNEKTVSPVIGGTYNLIGKEKFPMGHFGLNIKLNTTNRR